MPISYEVLADHSRFLEVNHCVILLRCIWGDVCFHQHHSLMRHFSVLHEMARTPRELDECARAAAEFVRTTSWWCRIAPRGSGELKSKVTKSCCQTSQSEPPPPQEKNGGQEAGGRRRRERNKLASTRHKLHMLQSARV